MDTRQRLRNSLDMEWVFVQVLVCVIGIGLGAFMGMLKGHALLMAALMFLGEIPIYIFLICRVVRIFQKTESYEFHRCTLSQPINPGLWNPWGSAAFYAVIKEQNNVLQTNHIFYTRGTIGPQLADYVNRTVTIAYNPVTGSVVVIGGAVYEAIH